MFSSRLSFILTAVGAAVGLGNVFRFPFLFLKYGAVFLLVYTVFLLFAGLPLLLFETGFGRHFYGKAPDKKSAALTKLCSFNALFVFCYYALLTAFVLLAVFYAFSGDFPALSSLQKGSAKVGSVLPFVFLIFALSFTLFCFGDGERIGKISVLSVIFSLVIILVLALVRGCLYFERILPLFRLDFAPLCSPSFWPDCLSQIFFSLSLAVGVLTAYGGLVKRGESLTACGLYIALIDLAVSLCASVIYASLGRSAEGLFDSFYVYPQAFFELGFFGAPLCLLFYFSLFFLCADSLVSYLKAAVFLLFPAPFKKEGTAAVLLIVSAGIFGLFLLVFGAKESIGFLDSDITPLLILFACFSESLFFSRKQIFTPVLKELSLQKLAPFLRPVFSLFVPAVIILLFAFKIFL